LRPTGGINISPMKTWTDSSDRIERSVTPSLASSARSTTPVEAVNRAFPFVPPLNSRPSPWNSCTAILEVERSKMNGR
jgi:hypothetical protein